MAEAERRVPPSRSGLSRNDLSRRRPRPVDCRSESRRIRARASRHGRRLRLVMMGEGAKTVTDGSSSDGARRPNPHTRMDLARASSRRPTDACGCTCSRALPSSERRRHLSVVWHACVKDEGLIPLWMEPARGRILPEGQQHDKPIRWVPLSLEHLFGTCSSHVVRGRRSKRVRMSIRSTEGPVMPYIHLVAHPPALWLTHAAHRQLPQPAIALARRRRRRERHRKRYRVGGSTTCSCCDAGGSGLRHTRDQGLLCLDDYGSGRKRRTNRLLWRGVGSCGRRHAAHGGAGVEAYRDHEALSINDNRVGIVTAKRRVRRDDAAEGIAMPSEPRDRFSAARSKKRRRACRPWNRRRLNHCALASVRFSLPFVAPGRPSATGKLLSHVEEMAAAGFPTGEMFRRSAKRGRSSRQPPRRSGPRRAIKLCFPERRKRHEVDRWSSSQSSPATASEEQRRESMSRVICIGLDITSRGREDGASASRSIATGDRSRLMTADEGPRSKTCTWFSRKKGVICEQLPPPRTWSMASRGSFASRLEFLHRHPGDILVHRYAPGVPTIQCGMS